MHIPGLLGIEVVTEGGQSCRLESPFPGDFYRIEDVKLNGSGSGSIVLRVQLDPVLLPVHVDGKKNVSRIRMKKGKPSIRMGLRRELGGMASSAYPENHLRLLSLTPEHIGMWEIAVVSQRGAFFLTLQETVAISLRRGIGGILYGVGPRLQNWPQMKKFLEDLLGERLLMLGEESPKEVPLGGVIWYNLAQGLGAIQTVKGAARVHWSQAAPREDGFRYLQQGERVNYQITPVILKQGMRPTSFQWEAKNVTPR